MKLLKIKKHGKTERNRDKSTKGHTESVKNDTNLSDFEKE